VAGFSLGEVSALTAAGVMTLETGFKVIKERAAAMQTAAKSSPGAMFAIIGASSADVEKVCATVSESTGGYVLPINYNCSTQIVLGGEEVAAQAAAQILTDSGLRVVRLAVNAAFHSKMMTSASVQFYDKIKDFNFCRSNTLIYSNISGDKVDISDPASYLKTQMISPVRFADEMDSMSRDGINTFVEMGPGKKLCGFIRRGVKGATSFNVEDLNTAKKCIEALAVKQVAE
jgi:[acyl-carrier-protein] S-malonyltransferase